MKIKDLISFIEEKFPLSLQESYDNSGLIVGSPHLEITNVLICLDSIEEVVDEAIDSNCNLIISHHPIIFTGIKRINGNTHIERTIIKAIKNDIAIYAIHTNLDNIIGGVNTKICDRLGLINQQILLPKENLLRKLTVYVPEDHANQVRNSLFDAGAGSIGNYKNCSFSSIGEGTFLPLNNSNPTIGSHGKKEKVTEVKIEVVFLKNMYQKVISCMKDAHPYEEPAYQIYKLDNLVNQYGSGMYGELKKPVQIDKFISSLNETMNANFIKHTKLVKDYVKTVSVCGGSGSFLINQAKTVGADVFISSDFKYHEFFLAEDDIVLIDVGHYESENYTKNLIYDILVNNFSKFAILLSKTNTNPINYLYNGEKKD